MQGLSLQRPRIRTGFGPASAGPRTRITTRCTHLHFCSMHSVTDYGLARRAVLRDFRRGALTRLDVCDAHPELIRAAQCIGTDLDDECPVCGVTTMRLVTYVYGE